jgi:hypothetical protein
VSRLVGAIAAGAGVEPLGKAVLTLRAVGRASGGEPNLPTVDAGLPFRRVLAVAASTDRSPVWLALRDAALLAAPNTGLGRGLGPAGRAAAIGAHLAEERVLASAGDAPGQFDESGETEPRGVVGFEVILDAYSLPLMAAMGSVSLSG